LYLTFPIFLRVLCRIKKKKLVIFGVTALVLVAIFAAIIIIFVTRNSKDAQLNCGSKFVSPSELGRYKKVTYCTYCRKKLNSIKTRYIFAIVSVALLKKSIKK